MNIYCSFIIFHLSSTSQIDLKMRTNYFHLRYLFPFLFLTLFIMGINDSVLDDIGFRILSSNELWSKTEVQLYISNFQSRAYCIIKLRHKKNTTNQQILSDSLKQHLAVHCHQGTVPAIDTGNNRATDTLIKYPHQLFKLVFMLTLIHQENFISLKWSCSHCQ